LSVLDKDASIAISLIDRSEASAVSRETSSGSVAVISGLGAGFGVCFLLLILSLFSRWRRVSLHESDGGHEMLYSYETDFPRFRSQSEVEDPAKDSTTGISSLFINMDWLGPSLAFTPEECFV
jgi:hypothetical protein